MTLAPVADLPKYSKTVSEKNVREKMVNVAKLLRGFILNLVPDMVLIAVFLQ